MNYKKIFGIIFTLCAGVVFCTAVSAESTAKVGMRDEDLGLTGMAGYDSPVPRLHIGNTEHYLCGGDVDKTGVGSWIEDEDGLDIYYEDRRDTGGQPVYMHLIPPRNNIM